MDSALTLSLPAGLLSPFPFLPRQRVAVGVRKKLGNGEGGLLLNLDMWRLITFARGMLSQLVRGLRRPSVKTSGQQPKIPIGEAA